MRRRGFFGACVALLGLANVGKAESPAKPRFRSLSNAQRRKLTDVEIKALPDDGTSGGLEAGPIVFDDAMILTPILYGETLPVILHPREMDFVETQEVTKKKIIESFRMRSIPETYRILSERYGMTTDEIGHLTAFQVETLLGRKITEKQMPSNRWLKGFREIDG